MKKIATNEEIAEGSCLLDNEFFNLAAARKEVCQEILTTILEQPDLIVENVDVQHLIQGVNREVYLDALCHLPGGRKVNIEVQNQEKNDDVRRCRLHASGVTMKFTRKRTEFSEIPDVIIVYISRYDALKSEQTVTHVKRCKKVDGEYIPVDDGEDIYFANSSINDGTDTAEMLQLMQETKIFNNPKFPALSNAVNYFKKKEGGRCEMNQLLKDRIEYEITKTQNDNIIRMLKKHKDIEEIADDLGLSVDYVKEVEKEMLVEA